MKLLLKCLIISVMLFSVGFTIVSDNKNDEQTVAKLTDVERPNDTSSCENRSLLKFVNKGVMKASWYGPRFHGRHTANGEVYDEQAYTAAHRSFKFGTLLRLKNSKNGKSIIVRVNDRGPFISKRQLDVSMGAALALGIVQSGVQKLSVSEVVLSEDNLPKLSVN